MAFNVSDFRVYAHRSKQFHVILGEDNMRQECGTDDARAVLAEPLLVSDVDDKHCRACSACGTSFHPLTSIIGLSPGLNPSAVLLSDTTGSVGESVRPLGWFKNNERIIYEEAVHTAWRSMSEIRCTYRVVYLRFGIFDQPRR